MKFILIKANKLVLTFICIAALFLAVLNMVFHQKQKVIGCTVDDIASITDISFLYGHDTLVQGDIAGNTSNTQIYTPSKLSPAQTPLPSPTAEPKRVFLTFDDGPSKTTASVLDILKEHGIKATFFVIAAENNKDYFPLVERIFAEGHQIGLHTSSHDFSKIYQSEAAFWADIELLKTQLAEYIDTQSIKYVRFPGGSTNTVASRYGGANLMKTLKASCEEHGYYWIDWNVCADDAVGGKPSADAIFENTIEDIKENQTDAVVLMHDTNITQQTVKALPDIIEWFHSNGYTFCRIDELNQ